ncbi:MAG TPA: ring-cleaving dioxygenase [Acidobacteriota bacterium]|nr:ring-cleaving dioxygenase [Acidobacteriota bacterium]
MSQPTIAGIHHVTAIAKDAQLNIDFYVGVLGLRLVKKTVNFDDPGTYHFYYGDGQGRPGTILTFFPWRTVGRGRSGSGETAATAFAVPDGQLGFWEERLQANDVAVKRARRLQEDLLSFRDPEGTSLELVGSDEDQDFQPWADSPVPPAHAIRGFHSVTLRLAGLEGTAQLLRDTMGFREEGEEEGRLRLRGAGDRAALVDLVPAPGQTRAALGAGSVHHVAWRVPDQNQQEAWRSQLEDSGYNVTPILDRNYFRSIYFREPGGVLFEFATDPPGFTADEPLDQLGRSLKLPKWLEKARPQIEQALPAVSLPGEKP